MFARIGLLLAVISLSFAPESALAGKQPPTGPSIEMSRNCPDALERFRRQSMRIYFAIAEDLTVCAYSYCTTACQRSSARRLTRHRCEKESGVTCRIYDAHDKVPEVEGY